MIHNEKQSSGGSTRNVKIKKAYRLENIIEFTTLALQQIVAR